MQRGKGSEGAEQTRSEEQKPVIAPARVGDRAEQKGARHVRSQCSPGKEAVGPVEPLADSVAEKRPRWLPKSRGSASVVPPLCPQTGTGMDKQDPAPKTEQQIYNGHDYIPFLRQG
ncbi:hypothetical protein SAMN04488112_10445 [Melghirimyces thermohalophilus]|uniref:Uncharacterized protein n=1 Tax=Melghirimyces thermohalophilus TaxID=1236220 RepID=A0A1G6JHG2_9BACL|nr:hypothetical protein SAMN04488112_10445 [Melghirimyces thermohalophilus]